MNAPSNLSADYVLLNAEHVSKRFGITQALDDVSVSFFAGEVHALMGENGAGKSTLGKVIAGLHKQDQGSVSIAGRVLKPGSIDDAFDAGIRIVHQELAQCPNLSVAENLCLHDIPTRGFGLIDRRAMNERAARLVHKLDPGIDVEAPLGLLAPGRRQICQIAASLDDRTNGHETRTGSANATVGGPTLLAARVIVLDEPTSSLSVAEADRLLEITRQLATQGLTMIYVSHRMGEIFQVCDRVSVLRDGKFVATSRIKDIDEPTLVEQMIGRRLQTPTRRIQSGNLTNFPTQLPTQPSTKSPTQSPTQPSTQPSTQSSSQSLSQASTTHVDSHAEPSSETSVLREIMGGEHHAAANAPTLLEVCGISSQGKLRDVSLKVRAGEIVGIGGLVGAGRSELLDAIFGLDRRAAGVVMVAGAPVSIAGPKALIAAGVGYVPEDRRLQGLFFQLGIDENIVVPFMPRLALAFGFRNRAAEKKIVQEKVREFQVKAATLSSLPGELSGGNQQKLLIARWMGRSTRVLLLDEPTRGIDVGTKAEVYKLIRASADAGAAVLLVSSEMPELLALSDRILVMCAGCISGELNGADMTQANILRLATVDQARRASALSV